MNYANSLEFTDTEALEIDKPIEDYNRNYFGTTVDGKFLPVYVISQVLISEQFSPLIGINVRTKSRVTANFQYKTKRDLSLNFSNAQITEAQQQGCFIRTWVHEEQHEAAIQVAGTSHRT